MLNFITPSHLPIDAAIIMGISAKEGDNAIGKFGTGLKYAIAGILRLRGSITITVGGEPFVFGAMRSDVRGKSFDIVTCNGEKCGFTADLGKHWKPWMLFRELASNTLDEGGTWTHDPHECAEGETVITVKCRDLEDAERDEAVFLPGGMRQVLRSNSGAQVYDAPSPYYYYNGIRAGSWGGIAPVTVDVSSGSLTEDRTLDLDTAKRELTWAFRSAVEWDADIVRAAAMANKESFWAQNMQSYAFEMPSDMADFLVAMRKAVHNPVMQPALRKVIEAKKGQYLEECNAPLTADRFIEAANRVCEQAGIDVIDRTMLHFTKDLPDGTLGVTRLDTREVWMSTKAVMLGQNEFIRTYLEECFHVMTGLHDNTREMQDALLAIIVAMAERMEAHHA